VRAAAGDLREQVELRRVGVGELVHVDVPATVALGGEQPGSSASSALAARTSSAWS
jgi:hypothetical protein